MSAQSATESKQKLTAVEVLDFGPVRDEAVKYFVGQDPSRKEWPAERIGRIEIRTECKWGRVVVNGDDGSRSVFMLNEKGEGPRAPLSNSQVAYVALYAAVKETATDPGYFEQKPFAKIPVNEATALKLRSIGMVELEKFITKQGAQFEEAYSAWRTLISQAQQRHGISSRRAARQGGITQNAPAKEIPIEGVSESEGEQGPRARA